MSGSLASRTFNNVDEHVLTLYRYVSGLFDVNNVNSKLSDVQLKIGSKIFYCHKFVLALSSKYFANLSFLSKTGTLERINSDHFYDVLQFMYTGEVVVTANNIESLLTAADILDMDDLLIICIRFYYERNIKGRTILDNIRTQLAQLYPKLAVKYFNKLKSSPSLHLRVPEDFMKAILSDDNLEVKSEVEVCEMLMKWLQVQTEAGNEVHPNQLLPLIRWSGVSVDYVKSALLQNATLRSDPAAINFLTKVMTYLQSGVQFEGLLTFHRPSTGLENCLLIIGLQEDDKVLNEQRIISLQHPSRIKTQTSIAINNLAGSVASLLNNCVYITTKSETKCTTLSMLNKGDPDWIKCADMLTGRLLHCAAVVNSMLYVLGGWVDTNKTALSSVECYNTKTNEWSSAGQLIHAVSSAACVTYKNSIYVFGGRDKDHQPVAHVQIYNPAQEICTLMDKPMPRACNLMKAVLWETSVILLGPWTCFIYNFESETWQEREQFKTGVDYFALTLDNSTVYVVGGGTRKIDEDNKVIWTLTDEIKSVSVLDIIQNKPAVWKHHAKLIKPALIYSYINISLPL